MLVRQKIAAASAFLAAINLALSPSAYAAPDYVLMVPFSKTNYSATTVLTLDTTAKLPR